MSANDYLISNSDSTKTIRVSTEGVTDDVLSIPLVGYFWDGYGEFIAQAQLHTLENFQNSSPPSRPVEGQLWYDSGTDKLKVYNSSGTWSVVGEAPQIQLNDLDDVTVTSPQEGNFLRYSSGQWTNQGYQSTFTDLTDTPSTRRPNGYIRSNANQTALVYFDKFNAATDFTGPITFEQLSRGDTLQQLCEWIKANNCIEEPLPPAFLVASHQGGVCNTTVGTSCTATGTLTAEIINPESTTPPYSYNWTKVDGTSLDGGDLIRATGVSETKKTINVQMTRTASSVGANSFTSKYKVSVTDANSQVVDTQESVSAATYVFNGTEAAPAPITNIIHNGGTCTSPPSTSCTANGFASINFNQSGTNSTAPYTYRWTVNDGGGAMLIPEGGGSPSTSVITTSPFVQTAVTSPVPQSNVQRSFGVSVRGTVGGQPNTTIASAQVPPASYNFIQGDPLPQDYTLRVFINGSAQTLEPAGGFRAFFENFILLFPTEGVEVQEGTETFITIIQNDAQDWNLVGVSGCDSNASLDQESDRVWTYSFVMPSNDCIVNITTEEQVVNYTISTSVPSGYSISPNYINGAQVPAGTDFQFTVNRTAGIDTKFDSVTGCGGTLDTQNQSDYVGPWLYNVTMPENDCLVTVNTLPIPTFAVSLSGQTMSYTNTPPSLPSCPGSTVSGLTTSTVTITVSGGVPPYNFVWDTTGLSVSENLSGEIILVSGDPATSSPAPEYGLEFNIINDCLPASASGQTVVTITDSEGRESSETINISVVYQQAESSPPPPIGTPPPGVIIIE